MADFSSLKQTIQNYIKQNGNEEITGNILQDVLLAMISTMGDSAINGLVTALQDEVNARQNADGILQGNITAESTARQNADGILQGNITAESTARRDADTALGGRIDGLQTAINGINTKLAEGYIYVGIATPSTNPETPNGKVFYIAVQTGTYTNFSSLVVTQGITILKYNGTVWSQEQIIGIDDEPTAGSNNLVKSGGVYAALEWEEGVFQIAMLNDKGLVFEHYIEENIIYNTGDGHRQEYAGYNSCVIAVEPNTFYQMWGVQITEGYGVLAYGDTVDVNGFISFLTPATGNNARITNRIKTPANCHYIAINIPNTTNITGKIIYKIKPELLVNSAAIYMANTVFDISGSYKYYASMDSLFVAVKPSSWYKIAVIYKNTTTFWVCQFDKDMNFISIDTNVKANSSFITDSNAAYIGIDMPTNTLAEHLIDIIECPNFNQRYMSGQPTFTEYQRADLPTKKVVVSVGMLGNTEANLSYNMDYNTGNHKYYDSTHGASWFAMSDNGGAIQYAPSGLDDSGDHDIWDDGGHTMVLAWNNSKGRLVVGTTSEEEQGNASISGNRQLSGGITFAGLTDCVIEGNRKKGTSGIVYINAYNDGDVSIAGGGGVTRLGGKFVLKDVAAPSSSSDIGEKGEIRFDSNYVYICVATNTWKRFALETW